MTRTRSKTNVTKKDKNQLAAALAWMPLPSDTDDYVAVMEAVLHEAAKRLEAYEVKTTGRSKLTR